MSENLAFPIPLKLDRFLPTEQVLEITGWSKQTLWREMKANRFPAAIPTSPNRVGWLESEVAEWQRRRVEQRDNPEWKRKGGGRPPKVRPRGETRAKPFRQAVAASG
jgi:prophage regulatory protein